MAIDIKYTIVDDFDHVFDEKGNTFLAIRKLYWGENSEKVNYDIRKWFTGSDGSESVGKGVGFLTEEGPNNLTRVLIEQGFGHTDEILRSIKDRKDFRSSLNKVLGKDDEYYVPEEDAGELFIPGNDIFDFDKE